MSKSFAMQAAVGLVALVCGMVVMEGQANARFKLFSHHGGGGCGCAAEASCGCAAEEPSCAAEPSCCAEAPAEEPSCAAEPSCGCAAEPSCGCSSGRKFKLFGRHRNRGGCGCESSCGAPAECGCGAPAEPSCGAPSDAAPAGGEAPPAPAAATTHWWVPAAV